MTFLHTARAAAALAILGTPLAAQTYSGSIEGGFASSDRFSTEDDIEVNPLRGGYIGGHGQVDINNFRLSINGRFEAFDDEGTDEPDETGPLHSGVLSLHAGYQFGSTYLGAFTTRGFFDGDVSENPVVGSLYGVEASVALNDVATAFVQIGQIEAIGDEDDNEFVGNTTRVGLNVAATDRVSAGFSAERGFSGDCFVDCGDEPGEFTSVTLDAAYALTDDIDLTGSVMVMDVVDFDDPDNARDTSIFLGARYNFGKSGGATALTAPMGGFRAAGWMEPLD